MAAEATTAATRGPELMVGFLSWVVLDFKCVWLHLVQRQAREGDRTCDQRSEELAHGWLGLWLWKILNNSSRLDGAARFCHSLQARNSSLGTGRTGPRKR